MEAPSPAPPLSSYPASSCPPFSYSYLVSGFSMVVLCSSSSTTFLHPRVKMAKKDPSDQGVLGLLSLYHSLVPSLIPSDASTLAPRRRGVFKVGHDMTRLSFLSLAHPALSLPCQDHSPSFIHPYPS